MVGGGFFAFQVACFGEEEGSGADWGEELSISGLAVDKFFEIIFFSIDFSTLSARDEENV